MRILCYAITGALAIGSVAAYCDEISNAILKRNGYYASPETNKLYVVAAGENSMAAGTGDRPPKFDDKICFGICATTTAELKLAWPVDKEKFCLIELLGAQGNEVAKTRLGREIGKHFYDIKKFGKERTAPIYASSNYGPGPVLFRPCDVFRLKRPGKYILRLQFQFYEGLPAGSDDAVKLLRFPTLNVPIERDPD